MRVTQYEIGDKIGGELSVLKVFGGKGKSGMGVVYLVNDRNAPFPYVLKTFQHRTGTKAADQFIAEANAWVQAGVHENIVQALWVREIDEQIFIAAEYIKGDSEGRNTLTDFISYGNLRDEIILNWAVQFCYGMKYAIRKGLKCHRDIKPDNLMITPGRTLKITDFGLAKTTTSEEQSEGTKKKWWQFRKDDEKVANISKTKTGTAMGTPPYMAPEQFIDAKNVDHRADIYSFGIIFYELISGGLYPYVHTPNLSKNPMQDFARMHLHAKPIDLESLLMPLVIKCLDKKKENRFQTYQELIDSIHTQSRELKIKLVPEPVVGASEDEELYTKAQSYIALKEPSKALNAINDFVSKFPERYCGWTEKSRIHYELNEYDESISAARKSLSIYPYNSHAWNNMGQALSKQETNLDEAESSLKNAIAYNELNTGAMANLCILLDKQNKYDDIPEILLKALKLCPEKGSLLFNAGNIAASLIENNRISAAKRILQSLTEKSPRDLNAWHNLALIYWQEKEFAKAVKCFEKVVEINPEDDFAWLYLAKYHFQNKNAKYVIQCCNKLLKLGKSVTPAVSMAAQVLNFTGNYPGALELLNGYLKQQPNNDTWWFILSEIHEFRDNYEEALKAAKHCKSILDKNHGYVNPQNIRLLDDKIKMLSGKL